MSSVTVHYGLLWPLPVFRVTGVTPARVLSLTPIPGHVTARLVP